MYTNFHGCHSLVTYTNSPLWPEAIFQCETESKWLTNFNLPLESTTVQNFKF